jgi:hypothetical protein
MTDVVVSYKGQDLTVPVNDKKKEEELGRN